MKHLTLDTLVYECLRGQAGKRLTGREIASWILTHHPDWCEAKRSRSKASKVPLDTDEKLVGQINAEIGAHHGKLLEKHPQLKATGTRPRLFYYSNTSDEEEVTLAETGVEQIPIPGNSSIPAPPRLLEKDLYPLLARYLIDELRVRSLRIDESKSSNRQGPAGNKWLFPDLVGLENLTEDWHETIRGCVEVQPESRIKLWSFEVKRLINRSNVREVFFQTVSNSSWANLAYLVAGEITGDETMKELQRLAGLHGVGVILLDIENPSESQILLHARERAPVDWNTVSRIAEENGDFLNYVKLITKFYKLGEIDKRDWLAQPTV